MTELKRTTRYTTLQELADYLEYCLGIQSVTPNGGVLLLRIGVDRLELHVEECLLGEVQRWIDHAVPITIHVKLMPIERTQASKLRGVLVIDRTR